MKINLNQVYHYLVYKRKNILIHSIPIYTAQYFKMWKFTKERKFANN